MNISNRLYTSDFFLSFYVYLHISLEGNLKDFSLFLFLSWHWWEAEVIKMLVLLIEMQC